MLNNTKKTTGTWAWLAWGLLLGVLAMLGVPAYAELGNNLSVDLRALSMGNAVTADPPGVSAVHYNPAGLANLDGRHADYQFLGAVFGITAQYSAPPGYNVFGYSDDPVVCRDTPNVHDQCTQFVTGKSRTQGVALYIPVLGKIVELPPGPLLAPLAAFSVKPPGSKFTFANALYAPLAAGYYRKPTDPGNFLGQDVAIERITLLSPSIGFKATDELSLGLSVGLSYQAIALSTDFRSPNELLGFTRLLSESICPPFKGQSNFVVDLFLFGFCNAQQGIGPFDRLASLQVSMQQTLSPTYNVGILWEPSDEFSWGAVYQSSASMHLHGHYQIDYGQGTQDVFNAVGGSPTGAILLAILGLPNHVPPSEKGLVSMDLVYPAHFQTGIKYMIMPDLKWNFDIGWSEFGDWDNFTFNFDRSPSVLALARLLSPSATQTSLSLPLGFRNVWNWGTGFEYSWNNRVKFRFGYEPRRSAIPDSKRTSLIPINNAHLFGTGIGYKYDKDTDIDLTLAYLYSRDSIPANTSTNVNASGLNNIIYNPYAGLDVKTQANILIFGIAYRTRW